MYCAKCGSQLVESANYCHVCGAKVGDPQTQTASSVAPIYEVCEITFNMTKYHGLLGGKSTWQWVAVANGPQGKYNFAVSQEFKAEGKWQEGPMCYRNSEGIEIRDQLIAVLLSSGWEPMDDRFAHKFRRRVN